MTRDFQVDIEPDNKGGCLFRLKSDHFPMQNGLELSRALPDLSPNDLDEMQTGQAPLATVERIMEAVSQWFLYPDLAIHLEQILQNGEPHSMRLILNVHSRLQADLTHVPFELLKFNGEPSPLLINERLDSLVHLLPRVRRSASAQPSGNWPLRVLLFRANPLDLGGTVPELLPLAQTIRALADDEKLPSGAIEIDVWSREPGADKPATFEAFTEQLQRKTYDILVFLGHGDLSIVPGEIPSGALFFETAEGDYSDERAAKFVAEVLQNKAPVVILAGCQTGAMAPDSQVAMRGLQGVAQALVNSPTSGVRAAVGMRYRLENQGALDFLQGFFKSLFKWAPGNVELAVRHGRKRMRTSQPHSQGWANPMLFRVLENEPFFGFMARPPQNLPSPETLSKVASNIQLRHTLWQVLANQASSQRSAENVAKLGDALTALEREMGEMMMPVGALLMPQRTEVTADQKVGIPVVLWGEVKTLYLSGQVSLPARVTLSAMRPSPALEAAGAQLLFNHKGAFRIEPAALTPDSTLSLADRMELFQVELELDNSPDSLNVIAVDVALSENSTFFWTGENALVVIP